MIEKLTSFLRRAGFWALLAASLCSLIWSGLSIYSNPLARPFVDRGLDDFMGQIERQMAVHATSDVVTARLQALLSESPRNWIAIQALEEIAMDRAIDFAPAVLEARETAWQNDNGFLTQAGDCAICLVDVERCSLSQALVCNAPVSLTPVGDVIGLSRAGYAAIFGDEIDHFELALSAVGLGATAATLATGGTSYSLKLGTSLLKMARKMTLLSPALIRSSTAVIESAVDTSRLKTLDDLANPMRAVDVSKLEPLGDLALDLGRMGANLSPSQSLHMMRFIETGEDARHIAAATEKMGSKTLGTLEVLGKSRFIKAALRWSDEAIGFLIGFYGLMGAITLAILSFLKSIGVAVIRREIAPPKAAVTNPLPASQNLPIAPLRRQEPLLRGPK